MSNSSVGSSTVDVKTKNSAGGNNCCSPNVGYIVSHYGLLRAVEMLMCLLCFVMVLSSKWCVVADGICCHREVNVNVYGFFVAVGVILFVATLIPYVLFVLNLKLNLSMDGLHLLDGIEALVCALFMVLASSLLAAETANLPSITGAVLMGFLAAVTFSMHSYLGFSNWWQSKQALKTPTSRVQSIHDGTDGNAEVGVFPGSGLDYGDALNMQGDGDKNLTMLNILRIKESSLESIDRSTSRDREIEGGGDKHWTQIDSLTSSSSSSLSSKKSFTLEQKKEYY